MPDKFAYVFPGQGSQRVGMGRDLFDSYPAAREVFEEADDALGFAISRLCFEGPVEELALTANTQPAILTTSTAIHRLVAARGTPSFVAGHSLGEYSALVAAGSLGLGDAVRLVRRRGEFMQQAVPVGHGAMAAILGLEAPRVEEIAAEAARSGDGDEVCVVANLNEPSQTVIAGHTRAVERATELARERGARGALMLSVSAPFHSPLMSPAREAMEPLLVETAFRDPSPPVITNVDARPATRGDEVRDCLVRQIDAPVRWVESIRHMAEDGVGTFIELGAGKVLSGLIRRIAPGVKTVCIDGPRAVEDFLGGGA